MDILNKPISEMSFDDIVDFCKLKVIEGVALEYKSDFPKDLAKQFVTFSNTQGGIIVIGIAEDPKTGLPIEWDGIDATTKPIDRVYQFASNVIPFPSFDVTTTNEKDGKVFVLIRVREGAAPPYATNNDPTPWVRTGNVSTPIVPANREELMNLLTKRDRARQTRETIIDFTRQTFDLDLAETERERKTLLEGSSPMKNIYKHPLGTGEGSAIFDISVMPYYPNRQLMNYSDLSQLHNFLGDAWQGTAFIHGTKSVPGGSAAFTWVHHSGHITSNQIYQNGCTYMAFDVMQLNDDSRDISAHTISHVIHKELMIAKRVFEKTKYNGQLSIFATLRGGKGAITRPLGNQGWHDSFGVIKYDGYEWSDDTDSGVLADKEQLANLHLRILKRICWDIGLSEIPDDTIMESFEASGWYK